MANLIEKNDNAIILSSFTSKLIKTDFEKVPKFYTLKLNLACAPNNHCLHYWCFIFFTRLAQQSSLSVDNFYTESENFVVNGYYVASYFTKSEPDKGKQSISTDF